MEVVLRKKRKVPECNVREREERWVGLFSVEKKRTKVEGKRCHAKTMMSVGVFLFFVFLHS